jgi:hypothetical protein
MSQQKFLSQMATIVAICFLSVPNSAFAQKNKIKTPNTAADLKEEKSSAAPTAPAERETPTPRYESAAAPRRLQQHGLGLGLGETFLLGNYGKHGEDKITVDALYSYAASYSFDLLVNAHMSEHDDGKERMKVMGLTTSIKARMVEYDNFSPYVLGGLGFYAPRAKRPKKAGGHEWSSQKVTFGLNFGGRYPGTDALAV